MTDPTPRDIHHTRRRAQAALDKLGYALPPAYTTLALIAADGYPTGGNTRSSEPSDPTPNAALTRGHDIAHTIRIRLRIATIALEELAALAETLHPGKAPADIQAAYQKVRCTGGGTMRGALEWGRPDCEAIADPHSTTGLCPACRLREYRWRQTQEGAA